jgi:hypothetical protein
VLDAHENRKRSDNDAIGARSAFFTGLRMIHVFQTSGFTHKDNDHGDLSG